MRRVVLLVALASYLLMMVGMAAAQGPRERYRYQVSGPGGDPLFVADSIPQAEQKINTYFEYYDQLIIKRVRIEQPKPKADCECKCRCWSDADGSRGLQNHGGMARDEEGDDLWPWVH